METGTIVAVKLFVLLASVAPHTKTIQETVAEAGERITSVVADTDNDEVRKGRAKWSPTRAITVARW